MKKSCINCGWRALVEKVMGGKRSNRCGLDMTMVVNRRMWCEMWKERG